MPKPSVPECQTHSIRYLEIPEIPENCFTFEHHLQSPMDKCCGFTPVGSSAPHSRSMTPPPWDMKENQKGKRAITHGLRSRQCNRQSKSCARKQSKLRNLFTPSHQQAGVQPLPGKQGSITCNSFLGRQMPSLRVPPLPPSSPSFIC